MSAKSAKRITYLLRIFYLAKNMSKTKYDNYGGIVNHSKNTSALEQSRVHTSGYNFIEKLLLKHIRKVNYMLDENGRYKIRNEKIPPVIRIGPTNRCTAQCFYCPREHVHNWQTGYMDMAMYERIVDWAKKNKVGSIAFALWGEPLLHPEITTMFDLAHQAGLSLRLSTNAIVLDKKLAHHIIKYPWQSIEMSMDGFTKKEFEKGKQVDKYEQAKANILYYLSLAKKAKVQTSFNIHFVDIGNVSLINKIKYVRYWKKQLQGLKYATTFYYEPHNWAGTRAGLEKQMGFIDKILSHWTLKKPCVYIKGLNINFDGNVFACANDPTPLAKLGNVKDMSLEKIYSSEKRLCYLEEHETGKFKEFNCGICTVNSIRPLLHIKKTILNKLVSIFS